VNVAPTGHPAGTLEVASPSRRAQLSRLAKSGRAIVLARGIYVLGASLPPDAVARYHRLAIIAHYWPGAVLCDRSALAGGEPVEGWMFVCQPSPARSADLVLPGVKIAARAGPGPLRGDLPFPHGLFLAGPVRGLVENVSRPGRPAKGRPPRAAGTAAVEDRVDGEARTGGAGRIANLLAQLDVVAPHFQPAEVLSFTPPQPRPALPGTRWLWLPFFESYFSNFIEGTEFGAAEARAIAIENKIPAARPQDAHDIAATFRIATDPETSARTAASGHEFIEILRAQHSVLLAAHSDKRPGEFKEIPNFVGGHAFVEPALVNGTLRHGFDCFAGVTDPFQRACALMLLITECHPFDDGNGRLARLVANAALSAGGQVRIVIPTVYRTDYLSGLNAVNNRACRGESLHAVLQYAQLWSASIDWSTFEGADAQLRDSNAYADPAMTEFAHLRLQLPG
jgi:hypothetical protein